MTYSVYDHSNDMSWCYGNKCLLAQALDWVYSDRRGRIHSIEDYNAEGLEWSLPQSPIDNPNVKSAVSELFMAFSQGEIEAYGYAYDEKPKLRVESDPADIDAETDHSKYLHNIEKLWDEVLPHPDARIVIIPFWDWHRRRVNWRYNRIYTRDFYNSIEEGCSGDISIENTMNPAKYKWVMVNRDQLLLNFPPAGMEQENIGGRPPRYDWERVHMVMARALYSGEELVTKSNAEEKLLSEAEEEIDRQRKMNEWPRPTSDRLVKDRVKNFVKEIYDLLPSK